MEIATETQPVRRTPPARILAAGATGIVLVGVWFGLTYLLAAGVPCQEPEWGCLTRVVEYAVIDAFVAMVVAWPVLRLFRVRPAWPVALLGAPILVLLVASEYELRNEFQPVLTAVSVPVAYALAALITAPQVRSRVRVLIITAVLVLWPLVLLLLADGSGIIR